MPTNLNNPEPLATQVIGTVTQKRSERAASILQEFRAMLPEATRGKRLSREEEDDILGFGPSGV